MSQRFHPRPSGRTIPVGSGSTDDEGSGRPCGAVGAALPLWWSLGGGGRKAPAARMGETVRMTDQQSPQGSQPDEENEPARIVVVTQDGMGVSPGPGRAFRRGEQQPGRPRRAAGQGHADRLDDQEPPRRGPQRPAGRGRPNAAGRDPPRSIEELKAGLAPELVDELERIALPFSSAAPSDAELRIAQAQLVGWLEGLFHGIQTALFAQQMAAQQQLQGMRRALPPGHPAAEDPRQGVPGQTGGPQSPGASGTGQYL